MKQASALARDFKPAAHAKKRRHLHWLLLLMTVIPTFSLLAVTAEKPAAPKPHAAESTAVPAAQQLAMNRTSLPLALPVAPASLPAAEPSPAVAPAEPGPAEPAPVAASTPEPAERTVDVKKGDTLSALFAAQGLSAKDVHDIMNIGKDAEPLKRIMPGQQLGFVIDDTQQLQRLAYRIDRTRTLYIERTERGFEAALAEKTPEVRLSHASGSIDSSLFLAAQQAGLSDSLTMELAGIFGWDVDFALDIREGDSFSVVYEDLYLDGEKFGTGAIVAAEFVNQGRAYRAVRYTDAEQHSDYYTPEGRSLRKAFTRTPVEFSRISSRFGTRRHPVLDRIRHHKGVDYAAPTGTPIKATGDGKVVFRGDKGGYGRTIIVQHGSQYSTLYAHMSKYARDTGVGSRVRQGQIIGYVGQSGLATGPHLHYEFRVNDVHRNPLTVSLPAAQPIKQEYLADFTAKSKPLLARLDILERGTVALAPPRD